MRIDTGSQFGARAARRLKDELIYWLVTVGPDGAPQPSPVWALWDGATLLIYSRPDTPKLQHRAKGTSELAQRSKRICHGINQDGPAKGGGRLIDVAVAALADGHRDRFVDFLGPDTMLIPAESP
jgi:hypothetical protein